MSLARIYDRTLRRKYSFRAVWLPGTEIKVGDILILKDGAFVSVGNIGNKEISFEEELIAEIGALDIKSTRVSKKLLQNGVRVSLDELKASADAVLDIEFNAENSYMLKTPKLMGQGMVSALSIARQIASLPNWDYQRNYVVHQVYTAEDFVFLGSSSKGSTLSFKGKGEAVKNFIEQGYTAELARIGAKSVDIEVSDQAGPVVLRLFRVKKNGDIF